MKVKFSELLNQLGVTADQTTIKIRDGVKDFDEAWEEYKEVLKEYKGLTDPEEKEAMLEEINQFEADLEAADNELVKKIQSWNKNKDSWAATNAKLQEGRQKKAGGMAKSDAPPVMQTQAAASYSNPNSVKTNSPTPQPQEEETSWGMWILGLGIAVVTLGVGAKFLKRS